MKKGKLNIKINFSNRWLYTFILLGIFLIIGIGVYAVAPTTPQDVGTATFGHTISEIGCTTDFCATGGKVGIGTTNPLSKLSVGGYGNVNWGIYGNVSADIFGSGVGVYGSGKYGVNGQGTIYGVRGQGSTGVLGSGSSYGVEGGCTYSSGTCVGVRGSGTSGGYDFYAFGPGTDYGTASSIRWKDNITEISGALNKILNLNGVYFNWNIYNNSHGMGFIAEDVGKVIPEIVNYDYATNQSNWYTDKNGDKQLYATGVDYGALSPVLVEAIKELKQQKDKEINELKAENKLLKERLNELCKKDKSYSWCR